MMRPVISIIIIAYNKSKEIPLVLAGLKAQQKSGLDWEINLLDDGSTDGTPDVAESCGDGLPLKVHRLTHSGNRNKLRNLGIRLSRGLRLAFLDGDIVPYSSYLAAHLESGVEPTVVLGSRLNLHPFPESPILKVHLDADVRFLFSMRGNADERTPHLVVAKLDNQPHPWRFVHSHNLSVPKTLLESCGGLDESLSDWGADDLELGYRLFQGGAGFRFDERAGGAHLFHPPSAANVEYRRNLERFWKKYHRPEVELLFVEPELTPKEAFLAYKALAALGEPARALVLHPDADPSNGRVLANHVLYPGAILQDGIGLGPPEPGAPPMLAYVVDGELAALGAGPLLRILEGGCRQAALTLVYDPESRSLATFEEISGHVPSFMYEREGDYWRITRKYVTYKGRSIFLLQNGPDPFLWNHQTGILSMFARAQGRKDILCYGDTPTPGVADQFLNINVEEQSLNCKLMEGRSFIFHPIWAKEEARKFRESLSVFWEDWPFLDEQAASALKNVYEIALFKSDQQLEFFRKTAGDRVYSGILEPCIDDNAIRCRLPGAKSTGPFKIAYISKYSAYGTGYDILLDCFAEEFDENENIECCIYFAPEQQVEFRNPFVGERHAKLIETWTRFSEKSLHWFSEREIVDLELRYGKPLGNLRVIKSDLSPTRIIDILRKSHLYVDPGRLSIPRTLTLMALACGTRTAVSEDHRQFSFLQTAGAEFLPSQLVAADFLGIVPAPMDGGTVPDRKFQAIGEIRKDALRVWMRERFEAWKSGAECGLDPTIVERTLSAHSRSRILNKLDRHMEEASQTLHLHSR